MFPKLPSEFSQSSSISSTATQIAISLILFLSLTELILSTYPTTTTVIEVDKSLRQRIVITVNVTFPAIPCSEVHLDAMDVAGDNQLDLSDTFLKQRLSKKGERILGPVKEVLNEAGPKEVDPTSDPSYCGDCYGSLPEGSCCNTCDDLLNAYSKKGWSTRQILLTSAQCSREKRGAHKVDSGEGCNLSGTMKVNKVAGNFHVAMGEATVRDGRHVHMFLPEDAPGFNTSHVIHELSFGSPHPSALDGMQKIVSEEVGTGLFQYFLKVMSTDAGSVYTHTERFRPLLVDVPDSFDRGVVPIGGVKNKVSGGERGANFPSSLFLMAPCLAHRTMATIRFRPPSSLASSSSTR